MIDPMYYQSLFHNDEPSIARKDGLFPSLHELRLKNLECLVHMLGLHHLMIANCRRMKIDWLGGRSVRDVMDHAMSVKGGVDPKTGVITDPQLEKDMAAIHAATIRVAIDTIDMSALGHGAAPLLKKIRIFEKKNPVDYKRALREMTGHIENEPKLNGVFRAKSILDELGAANDREGIEILAGNLRDMTGPLEDLLKEQEVFHAVQKLGFFPNAKRFIGEPGEDALEVKAGSISGIDASSKQVLLEMGGMCLRMKSAELLLDSIGAIDREAILGDAAHNKDAGITVAFVRGLYVKETKHRARPDQLANSTWVRDTEHQTTWDVIVATRWAMNGFPVLSPTHKLAAANMATSIPEDLVPDIAMPWTTFVVDVPNGLVPQDVRMVVISSMSEFRDVEKTFMAPDSGELPNGDGKFMNLLVYPTGSARPLLWVFQDVRHLANVKAGVNLVRVPWGSEDNVEPQIETEETQRLMEMLGRLVLGSLIELDSEERKDVLAKGRRSAAEISRDVLADERVRRGDKTPSAWSFVLKRDVRVDAREYVHDYITHGTRKLSVQLLVRGHRKRQPYGPKGLLRKWVHIEPYWRGPEDAPIAMRSHKVVGSDIVGPEHLEGDEDDEKGES